jgi:hypothetical protein
MYLHHRASTTYIGVCFYWAQQIAVIRVDTGRCAVLRVIKNSPSRNRTSSGSCSVFRVTPSPIYVGSRYAVMRENISGRNRRFTGSTGSRAFREPFLLGMADLVPSFAKTETNESVTQKMCTVGGKLANLSWQMIGQGESAGYPRKVKTRTLILNWQTNSLTNLFPFDLKKSTIMFIEKKIKTDLNHDLGLRLLKTNDL